MYRQRLQVIAREAGFPVDRYGDDHFILSKDNIGELRVRSYLDQWRLAHSKGWFHVRMHDHSLFLFSEGAAPSYSYLQCPLVVPSYPDYLHEIGVSNTPENRRRHLPDYEQVFDTADVRSHVTPIRFDYDPNGYRSGVHPVAHVHIGLDNDVRLACNRMSATSFLLFVMRQMYPESWVRLLARTQRNRLVSSIRATETRLNDEFWQELDKVELHLG